LFDMISTSRSRKVVKHSKLMRPLIGRKSNHQMKCQMCQRTKSQFVTVKDGVFFSVHSN